MAMRNYTIGRFDEAIATITRCLEDGDYDEAQRKEALRILSLSYLAKDRAEEARDAMQRLLELMPDYQPDPELDPPTFVDMVKDIREKMAAEAEPEEQEEQQPSVVVRDRPREDPPPVVTSSQPASKRGIGRWLLVGGVAVAGGVAAAVLLGGGGGGNPTTIGPPPALPSGN